MKTLSVHELCPKCCSAHREFIGTENNIGIEELALWKCKGCGITYDGPMPPYDIDPVFDLIDELVKI